jgi:hypothetical protein
MQIFCMPSIPQEAGPGKKRPDTPIPLVAFWAMKQEEPAFYVQVKRGIVLWEAIDELAS